MTTRRILALTGAAAALAGTGLVIGLGWVLRELDRADDLISLELGSA